MRENLQAAEQARRSGAARGALLIVEDDLHSREGLRDLLARSGFSVEIAADGIQAIRKVKDAHFGGAIIDLDLPRFHGLTIDGWDVARICRAFVPDIALVLVSAEGGAHVGARARGIPRCDFIEKPIDPERLKATLGRLALGGEEERGDSRA
ncbi:MAG: response regulator [Candidatus Rokubacteria bacterium]|nr:response regulator [Candidatus Rokubacteria bacterium]MBI3105473.1 response regulator [Candidatus Rokubacteria bacterium]